jgi:L-2-hydroxyglutarate oxidase
LYYKPGSLKAINCINGYNELIKFCNEEDIPFEIIGKVVVTTRRDQLQILDTFLKRGLQHSLDGTRRISLEELKEFEPYCPGVGAINLPQTGIVDYLKVALAYGEKIKELGGEIYTNCKVLKIEQQGSINQIETSKIHIRLS